MDFNTYTPKTKPEEVLLSLAKDIDTFIEQTKTKAQGNLEFKSTKSFDFSIWNTALIKRC